MQQTGLVSYLARLARRYSGVLPPQLFAAFGYSVFRYSSSARFSEVDSVAVPNS